MFQRSALFPRTITECSNAIVKELNEILLCSIEFSLFASIIFFISSEMVVCKNKLQPPLFNCDGKHNVTRRHYNVME